MKEFILRYWIEVVLTGIVTGLTVVSKHLWCKIKCANAEQEAIRLGIQALLRDRIIQSYNKHLDMGYVPIYALENVDAMYLQYHNLGGNGTITKLVEKMRDMPTEPEKEK